MRGHNRNKTIESMSQKLLGLCEVKEAPVPLNKIADKVGLKITPFDFHNSVSGVLKRDKGAIGVNKSHAPVRQRFTVAHEIGHYVLGHDRDDFVDRSFDSTDILEKEANVFASCLLMPKNILEEKIKKDGVRNLEDLAKDFGVSKQAMTIRLLKLKLI